MTKRLSILLLVAFVGCTTPTTPTTESKPPVTQTWTNRTQLPPGQLADGIAIYFRAPPSAKMLSALMMATATKHDDKSWTIDKVDNQNKAQTDLIILAAKNGATFGPYQPPKNP